MEKWIAAFLQVGAAVGFIAVGAGFQYDDMVAVVFGVPAAASGIAGLLLWNRGAGPSLAATRAPQALEAQVARVEATLSSMQHDVAQLREDREFFRELYQSRPDRSLP